MFYFAKHGRIDENLELSAEGVAQAEQCGERLSTLGIKHFYASNSPRALQTAETINQKLGLDIVFDERLKPLNLGDLDESVLSKEQIREILKDPAAHHAESNEDMYKRVRSFLDDLIEAKIDDALIVSHKRTMRMIKYCHDEKEWNEEKFKEHRYKLGDCQIVRLNFYGTEKFLGRDICEI